MGGGGCHGDGSRVRRSGREGRARLPIGSEGARRPSCGHAQWRRGEVRVESGRGGFRAGLPRTGCTGGSSRGAVLYGTDAAGPRPLRSAGPSPPRRRRARRHCCPGLLGPLGCASPVRPQVRMLAACGVGAAGQGLQGSPRAAAREPQTAELGGPRGGGEARSASAL